MLFEGRPTGSGLADQIWSQGGPSITARIRIRGLGREWLAFQCVESIRPTWITDRVFKKY